MLSSVRSGASVTFPEFTGERIYMEPFTQKARLPGHLSRWQRTVDALLEGLEAPELLYLMVDQAIVPAGHTHRRPGVHLDGYWCAGSHGSPSRPPEHQMPPPPPDPPPEPPPGHGHPPGHIHHAPPGHAHGFGIQETLILASDVCGSAAYVGDYLYAPGAGGDCSHVDLRGLSRVELRSHVAWIGCALTTLHESLPLAARTPRTVVRLNVTGLSPSFGMERASFLGA